MYHTHTCTKCDTVCYSAALRPQKSTYTCCREHTMVVAVAVPLVPCDVVLFPPANHANYIFIYVCCFFLCTFFVIRFFVLSSFYLFVCCFFLYLYLMPSCMARLGKPYRTEKGHPDAPNSRQFSGLPAVRDVNIRSCVQFYLL